MFINSKVCSQTIHVALYFKYDFILKIKLAYFLKSIGNINLIRIIYSVNSIKLTTNALLCLYFVLLKIENKQHEQKEKNIQKERKHN